MSKWKGGVGNANSMQTHCDGIYLTSYLLSIYWLLHFKIPFRHQEPFFFFLLHSLTNHVISQAPHHMLHYGRVGEVLRSCTWFIGMLYLIWRAWNCTYHLSSEAYDDFPWHSNQSPLKHWSSEAYCCTKMSIRCNLLSSWYLQSRKDY